MKFERIERLQPHTHGKRFSTFLYVDNAHDHGDAVYVGSEDGKVGVYWLMANSSKISNFREVDLPKEESAHHNAQVNCMLHSRDEKLAPPTTYGLLFTGASDRLVKVWDSAGNHVQNLPHSGPVLRLADAQDGSILSISIDGYLRVWAPQAGRSMMLNPYFECVTHLSTIPSRVEGWLGAGLCVNSNGNWSCYVGDSDGGVSVYRKPPPDLNSTDEENAVLLKQLKLHAKWDQVYVFCSMFLPFLVVLWMVSSSLFLSLSTTLSVCIL
jgi:WD40 repeat protein